MVINRFKAWSNSYYAGSQTFNYWPNMQRKIRNVLLEIINVMMELD